MCTYIGQSYLKRQDDKNMIVSVSKALLAELKEIRQQFCDDLKKDIECIYDSGGMMIAEYNSKYTVIYEKNADKICWYGQKDVELIVSAYGIFFDLLDTLNNIKKKNELKYNIAGKDSIDNISIYMVANECRNDIDIIRKKIELLNLTLLKCMFVLKRYTVSNQIDTKSVSSISAKEVDYVEILWSINSYVNADKINISEDVMDEIKKLLMLDGAIDKKYIYDLMRKTKQCIIDNKYKSIIIKMSDKREIDISNLDV